MQSKKSLHNWLKVSTEKLQKANIESARLDNLILAATILKKSQEWLRAHEDYELTDQEMKELNTKVIQRAQHIPLAYLTSAKEFYGRPFYVNEDVLIPRPESESFITLLRTVATRVDTAIDIGTGSGCLAISTKLEYPALYVIATDLSKSALIVAKKNAANLKAHITFIQTDLLAKIDHEPSTVLLANLPYVPENLITSEEITKEPAEALFSGSDGLNHYRQLWQQISMLSSRPLYVMTESLESQHRQLEVLAQTAGYRLVKTDTLVQLFTLS